MIASFNCLKIMLCNDARKKIVHRVEMSCHEKPQFKFTVVHALFLAAVALSLWADFRCRFLKRTLGKLYFVCGLYVIGQFISVSSNLLFIRKSSSGFKL